jgi:hypothetical protein
MSNHSETIWAKLNPDKSFDLCTIKALEPIEQGLVNVLMRATDSFDNHAVWTSTEIKRQLLEEARKVNWYMANTFPNQKS